MKATKLFIISILVVTTTFAMQQLFSEIANSIRTGNAREVAKYLNTNVDITILNQEGMYSKPQAEVMLSDFFNKNKPKSFEIIHQGASKEGAKYAIGTLVSHQGAAFRVYIFVKPAPSGSLIHELRFEKN